MKTKLLIWSIIILWAKVVSLAQVAINNSGTAPNSSAGLDIDFTNRGLLIPRVSLTQTSSPSPITSPAHSLLVFNTATQNDVTPGYYYWDSNLSRWVRLGFLNCSTPMYVLKTGTGFNYICSQIYDNGTNVGIGTSSPSHKLEVAGTIYANNGGIRSSRDNGWANHDIYVAATNEHPAFVGLRGRGTNSSPSYPQNNDVLCVITGRDIIDGYSGYGGNNQAFGGASIEFRAGENFSGTNKGSFIAFNITPYGGNIQWEAMRLNPQGRLGIGTTSPLSPLHVYTSYSNLAVASFEAAGKRLDINVGTNIAGVSNSDGVVWFDVAGTEYYLMGGHVLPDNTYNSTLPRDLGDPNKGKVWRYLYVQDVYSYNLGGWISSWSDERMKKNVKTLHSALDNVLKLRPVEFYWKKEQFPDKHFSDNKQFGLIAQEVEQIYPELVNTTQEGYKNVDYIKLTPILIKAIQELTERVTKLENENRELKEFNKNLINSLGK
ncbi:MAG: tail fiber domain-containing protein [Bacteroidales bacterium]|nr:tail fiber domain-containing protein [Bacteroidales bacterium]